ncbi:MAG: DbpA RNA binding domain-containing protein, partial [Nocardioidaceae bacterium]|nr:DbpA RNA binding domain-containing protein [Nocardioidaceae bacterium]
EPRQIVGALANEGGLRRSDFGRIEIKPNFSLVELPADLSKETLKKLASTRISGVLIDIRRDEWQPPRRRAKSAGPKGHRKGQGRPR